MNHVSSASFALVVIAAAVSVSVACTQTNVVNQVDPSLADSGVDAAAEAGEVVRTTSRVEGKSADLFGSTAKSYAYTDDETGEVVSVGYSVPVAAFEAAPANAPFQDDLVLEMPKVARDTTILNHVRVNWLTAGHGPDPYGEAHFDMHFQRGTLTEVDAIDCKADKRNPPATALPTGYGLPELCVNAMGMHSWPKTDISGSGTWTGSIIMGFWATKVSFIEPMISKAKLLEKKTFELAIEKPESTGGAHTLYPRRLTAKFDEAESSYSFEFDKFEPID